MSEMIWAGVMPAITTPLSADGHPDGEFLGGHATWLADHGCTAIIALGSLGEGATLDPGEKRFILDRLVHEVGARVPVVASIGAASTGAAVALARSAEDAGCRGLMLLPPYVHRGPWREMQAHFRAVLDATALPCMLYNNPAAYGFDVDPEAAEELAGRHDNLRAMKESSGDARRITALRALLGDRLAPFVGLDDMVLEGVAAGAVGWVAGLVNALPAESVALFEALRRGENERAFALLRWFLPLLRLDTAPEFVQLIKLVQAVVGRGTERVRPPRQPVVGVLREQTLAMVHERLATRPSLEGG